MDALKQYIDLYRSHADLIVRHSAGGFNALRSGACASLEELGLPAKGSENYEVTDLGAMLAPDYGINVARVPVDMNPLDGFRCGIPHLSSALFFMLGDRWAESAGGRQSLPEGVEVGPLSRFLSPEGMAAGFYGSIADLANPIVALNTMLVQEGMYLRVRKGVRLERPLQLVNLLEGAVPMMAFRRLLIVLEEDSEARLLTCCHTSASDSPLAGVSVAEIFVGRNARLDFYDMEESGPMSRRLTATYLRQEEGSDVLMENFTLHNGMTRNEYHCRFAGRHATLKLCGLAIEGRDSVLDNYSRISHDCPDCTTEELFKYIVDDEARGAFDGMIYVAPGATGTQAYQSNRNLVGSERASMFTKPSLEIYNDDVKCSHGSATGQLDPMQLFYLRSRGLSEEEARFLLRQAFMADVTDSVRLPILKDRLHSLVERRLSGEDATCGDCEICK